MCAGTSRAKQVTDEGLVNQAIDKVKTICANRQIECSEEILSAMVECFLAGMSYEAHLAHVRIKKGRAA